VLNFSKVILLSSFAVFLIFATPNAFAQSFDEGACLSLLSPSQVQSATGFDGKIDIREINTDLATLNEDLSSGCMITFENEDRSFTVSVALTESFTESDVQSKYGEMLSAVNQMGYEVQSGNNGPWIYHLVEINEKGLGSILTSVKDKIMIGVNAPQTDFPVKSSALIEIMEILHSNIDKFKKSNEVPTIPDCPEGTKQVGNACMELDPNDVEPTNVEPVEITEDREQKIVELEQPTVEQTADTPVDSDRMVSEDPRESEGGGCLIATATYGSELAPQVQQLREIRDNSLLKSESGTSFMSTFNDVYYTFSPVIADYERENPVFREMVKATITPMISSLSILNYVEMDSESSVLGYGISLILLNVGMYVGIPVAIVVGIRKVN